MMINKVEICGVNTAKLPTLTEKEKRALFEKIKNGDQSARAEFIYGNLRLVLSVLQRFNNRGENIDDLFQVGCIGLIKALDNFDTSHGVRFSTYAVPMNVQKRKKAIKRCEIYHSALFKVKPIVYAHGFGRNNDFFYKRTYNILFFS